MIRIDRDCGPARLVVEVESESETDRLGRALAAIVEPNQVIGLIGELGAGKTRLTRALALALGADPRAVSSPTFILIQEYEGRVPIYHFDAYRLQSIEQFESLGVDEYWTGGGVCVVEWADRVLSLLPESRWVIRIRANDLGHRAFDLDFGRRADLADRMAAELWAASGDDSKRARSSG